VAKSAFDSLKDAQIAEKKAWMTEKASLEAEVLSGRTSHARAIATVERERSDLTRIKDVELEQQGKVIQALMEEKNAWVVEKERLNGEILTSKTDLARATATAAREKLDLTRTQGVELEQQYKSIQALMQEKSAWVKEKGKLNGEILTAIGRSPLDLKRTHN
jgi:hypothetical protein